MSVPEPMPELPPEPSLAVHPGRRGASLIAGGVGVVGLAVLAYIFSRPKPTPPPTQPTSQPQQGIQITAIQVLSATPGQPMTVQVTLFNQSPTPLQDTISGQAAYQGSTVTTFPQQPVSISGGQTTTVTIQSSSAIPDTVAGDTVTITFTLATSGSTLSTTTQVQGSASFSIVSAVVTPNPVQPGQPATASVVVQNSGSAPGTVTVAGVITYLGKQVGTFTPATSGTVQPNQTAQVPLTSASAISQSFAGDTLIATFSLPNGQSMEATFQVSGEPDIIVVDAVVTSAVAGQYGQASVTVTNQGQGQGTIPNFTLAETVYNGQAVGRWVPVQGVGQQLGPGQTTTVSMRSDGLLYAGYVGDTLEAVFEMNGSAVSVPFTVQAAPSTGGTSPSSSTSSSPSTSSGSTSTSTSTSTPSICSSLQSQYNSVYQQLVSRAQYDIQQGITYDPTLASLTNELNSIRSQMAANGCG